MPLHLPASPNNLVPRVASLVIIFSLFLSLSLLFSHRNLPSFPSDSRLNSHFTPMNSAVINQYSIWAVPPQKSPLYARTKEAMRNLRVEFGTPEFEPHVTIIGAFGKAQGLTDADVIVRTKELSENLRPFEMPVKGVFYGEKYFQCVFLKMDPTDELLHANWQAKLTMSMIESHATKEEATKDYMPHLSLIYGNLTQQEKERAEVMVKQEFSDLSTPPSSFTVKSLALYRTDPEDWLMKTWEKLGEFDLRGRE